MQEPSAQVSPVVQPLPSSQGPVLSTLAQPEAGSQLSLVQVLLSLQSRGVPEQTPPLHASPTVHALPSSQDNPTGVFRQPMAASQLSVVQTLLSSQFGAGPPTQVPAWQMSLVVQAFPSSQAVPSADSGSLHWPLAGAQLPASWHWSLAVHSTGSDPAQAPAPSQVSTCVQASPSSQDTVLNTFAQPSAASQLSVVQTLPSPQSADISVLTQPEAGLQLSTVQTSLSLQSGAAPPTQAPAEQVSAVVQASPSSQATVLAGLEQPLSGSQTSSVQTTPSAQSGGVPPTQLPPKQASPVVQASPSSQADPVLAKLEQLPSASLHWSSVHASPSLQTNGLPPWQIPAEQVSPMVQLIPSSQASELAP